MLENLINEKVASATNSRSLLTNFFIHILEDSSRNEIIIPSFCCEAIYFASYFASAKTVLADSNPVNCSISINHLESLITSKTCAVVIPHIFGILAYSKDLLNLYKKHEQIIWIDDPCQTYLSKYKNNASIGSILDFSIYSFNSSKPLDGNISFLFKTTNNQSKVKLYESFLSKIKYSDGEELNKEILRIQSSYFISQIGAYRNLNNPIELDKKLIDKFSPLYKNLIKPGDKELIKAINILKKTRNYEYPFNSFLNRIFYEKLPENNAYKKYKLNEYDKLWRYPIFLRDKNDVSKLSYLLRKNNINVSNHYFSISYLFPAKDNTCKVSEKLCDTTINLWFNSEIEVENGVSIISQYFKSKNTFK